MTKGRNGANSRSRVDSASGSAAWADARRLVALAAVGPALDQLEVVVAEAPEERLGALEGAGVVVAVEGRGGLVDQVGQAGEHGPVERLGDGGEVAGAGGAVAAAEAERELGCVEQLDGEAPADLHLALVEGGVGAGPAAGGPVAHGVGAVLLEQCRSGVTTLPFDFDIFLRSGSRIQPDDGGVPPRQRVVLEVGAHDGGEQPGADDLVGLGAQVHREGAREQVGVVVPAGGDLRRERRRGPRVHDVGVADEAAGLAALGLRRSRGGTSVDGSTGSDRLVGQDRLVVVGRAVGVERVPDRERARRRSAGG